MSQLAVIIPAYKAEFFEKALTSLVSQTNQDFTVYIGDDNSPHNLKPIVDKYTNLLKIEYKKFEYNIGSKNLVLQWNRCVQLSKNESWIWLFSDDDIADRNAVKNFYRIFEKTKGRFDLYRYNTVTIDRNDNIICYNPVGPNIESSEEMAYNLLLGKRGNSMPDHIFSRRVYELNKGFVFTQYAQGADWATSILFSAEKGICIIPDAFLYWRYSGINISSLAARNSSNMLIGHLQFIKWVLIHFEFLKNTKSKITYDMIKSAAYLNLKTVVINHYKSLSFVNSIRLFKILFTDFGYSLIRSINYTASIKFSGPSFFKFLVKKITK